MPQVEVQYVRGVPTPPFSGETLTPFQYKAMLKMYYYLVRERVPPSLAQEIVLRATSKALQKTFKVPRYPFRGGMGQVGPGQCTRIDVDPAREEEALSRIHDFRVRGFNIMRISPFATRGFGRKEIVYACPPGYTPAEHQPQVLQAERL